jgi:hypothetical protein
LLDTDHCHLFCWTLLPLSFCWILEALPYMLDTGDGSLSVAVCWTLSTQWGVLLNTPTTAIHFARHRPLSGMFSRILPTRR